MMKRATTLPSQVFYDIQRNSCCFFLCFSFSMGYEVPEFKHTTIYDTSLPTYNDLSPFLLHSTSAFFVDLFPEIPNQLTYITSSGVPICI
jgi:hypothetical protein